MRIKKGDKFLCGVNLHSTQGHHITFKRGEVYESGRDGYITNELGEEESWEDRIMLDEIFLQYDGSKENEESNECEDMQSQETKDNVNHPSHYTWLKELCGVEVIDITRHMDFDLGNAIKYILRCGHKSDAAMTDKEKAIEDLDKAKWYINDRIEMLKK